MNDSSHIGADSLPDPILITIFKKLNPTDLANAARTCKRWSESSKCISLRNNATFTKRIFDFTFPRGMAALEYIKVFGCYFKYLTLNLDNISDWCIDELFRNLTLSECKLRELNLRAVYKY